MDGERRHQSDQRPRGHREFRPQDQTQVKPGIRRRLPTSIQTAAALRLFARNDADPFGRTGFRLAQRFQVGRIDRIETLDDSRKGHDDFGVRRLVAAFESADKSAHSKTGSCLRRRRGLGRRATRCPIQITRSAALFGVRRLVAAFRIRNRRGCLTCRS
jgi:hypothetical protein